ncbi:MAG: transporter [Gemmatimonadota bacterium]
MNGANGQGMLVRLRCAKVSRSAHGWWSGSTRVLRIGLAAILFPLVAHAQRQSDSSGRDQSLDDAWWTGPMLAASPNTLPAGHILLEPYFFDVKTAHTNGFGTLTYALVGLFDRLTVGSIIITGWNKPDDGTPSSGMGLGDVTMQATYRLTRSAKGSWVPITAVVLQETLPTGKFDRLGHRPSDGLGSGSYTSSIAFYAQSYYWLANHRILRMRLNLTQSFSNSANLHDVSVYGTPDGFRGTAKPGAVFASGIAAEYSLTQRWVLAFDAQFNHYWNTRVSGFDSNDPVSVANAPSILLNSGSHHSFAFAPALEYSWTPNIGVLLGTRFIPAGKGTISSITPAIAINFVH